MTARRRAVALVSEDDTADADRLVEKHDLDVVYTAHVTAHSPHAPTIAAGYVLELDAETVVLPWATTNEVRENPRWRAVNELADLVTTTGVVECRPPGVPAR